MATQIGDIQAIHWQPRLGSEGEIVEGVADIAQDIRIVLLTRKGQDPLRPEFGSDLWRHVDRPVSEARPHVVRETAEAIERWVPRAALERVEVAVENARLVVRVVWRPAVGGAEGEQVTEVAP